MPTTQDLSLAIDLGGTKAAFAVIDAGGSLRARSKRVSRPRGKAIPFDDLAEAAREVVWSAGVTWDDVRAAGVLVPGIYTPSTGKAWAPNLWGWEEILLRPELESRFPVPVRIDSDRSGYVLGEQWLGAARGCTDVVFLAVGTGIGAGILSAGRLIRGSAGIAGAAGWFAVDPRWKQDYAHAGCWEAEAAGPALAQRAAAMLSSGGESVLPDMCGGLLSELTAEMVTEAARGGDFVAMKAVDETVEYLCMGIAGLISLLNPQVIVLGGGLMRATDLFLDPIRRGVLRWAQPIAAKQARIEVSQLGDDAGLFGAARLALHGEAP